MNNEQEKKSLWLPCPKCGARSKIKIYEDTVLLNFPLSPEEKQEYRKKSILCMSGIFLLAFLALALHIQSVFCFCSISLSLESILLLLGKHSTTKFNRRIH